MAKKNVKNEFHYVAQRRVDAKVFEDDITAPSIEAVEEVLLSRGLIPLNISPATNRGLNKEISFSAFKSTRVKRKDIAIWARQFSIMTDAGLTVAKALAILSSQTEKDSLREVTADIRNGIESGLSLADSMERHVDVFGDLIVNMIRAGEHGGFLDETLMQIALDLEKEVKLRAKVRSAMTYPVVVLVMAILLTSGMLIFIVPIFTNMFSELGGQLPLPTRILVWLSDVMKIAVVPLIAVAIVFSIWWRKNKEQAWIRNLLDPIKLKVPVFGKLTTKIVLARFSRNLGTLIGAGVPLLKALDIVNGTVGNVVVSRALNDVRTSVSQGESISGPLSEHDVFPPMVTQMIAVGEDAGEIEVMLEKISEDYDQQVETTAEQLSSLIEPLMIAFLGFLVGGMVIALYMPIFSMYDLIQ